MVEVVPEPFAGTLSDALRVSAVGDGSVRVYWLGQAGFVLTCGRHRVVVDPYLSDSLAAKYAGGVFSHQRLTAPPIAPSALDQVSLILCTHRHSDHMDPGTLPLLAAANPSAKVVVPLVEHRRALQTGIPESRIEPIDAGQRIVRDELTVEALPAAHEELATDSAGHHSFLGYAVKLGGLAIYHSGDCVPYDGLAQRLSSLKVDVALLPINGRDDHRRQHGVLGNFTLQEAIELCRAAQIPILVGHHFGLFAFNTVDLAEASRTLAGLPPGLTGMLARPDAALRFRRVAVANPNSAVAG